MLIVNFLPLVLAITATRATSLPPEDDSESVLYISSPVAAPPLRQKRSAFPGRAMMFHGYFGSGGQHPYPNPVTSHHGYASHNNRPYDPQGSMTAFAAGNTISTGSSYYGGGGGGGGLRCTNCDSAKNPANGNGTKKNGHGPSTGNGRPTNGKGDHQHEVPSDIPATDKKPVNANGQEQTPIWNQDVGYPNGNGNGDYLGDQPAVEEVPKEDTLSAASPNIPADPEDAKKGPAAEDSDDEEEEDEPSFFSHGKGRGKGQGPYYNSYFPMVFGYYPGLGGGRHGNREDGIAYNPGTSTAIANSFSTGRGAVATSHAISYGGPHFAPSGYRRSGSRGRPH